MCKSLAKTQPVPIPAILKSKLNKTFSKTTKTKQQQKFRQTKNQTQTKIRKTSQTFFLHLFLRKNKHYPLTSFPSSNQTCHKSSHRERWNREALLPSCVLFSAPANPHSYPSSSTSQSLHAQLSDHSWSDTVILHNRGPEETSVPGVSKDKYGVKTKIIVEWHLYLHRWTWTWRSMSEKGSFPVCSMDYKWKNSWYWLGHQYCFNRHRKKAGKRTPNWLCMLLTVPGR